VPAPAVEPAKARLELARRYLHSLGPATPEAFAAWAGIKPRLGVAALDALRKSLMPVRTSSGDAWILAKDEPAFHAAPRPAAAARLLPSGDAYLLAADRELLVADATRRRALWPPSTVWPGGLLVQGELVGTWRRAQEDDDQLASPDASRACGRRSQAVTLRCQICAQGSRFAGLEYEPGMRNKPCVGPTQERRGDRAREEGRVRCPCATWCQRAH
jgi:hypothetical protein